MEVCKGDCVKRRKFVNLFGLAGRIALQNCKLDPDSAVGSNGALKNRLPLTGQPVHIFDESAISAIANVGENRSVPPLSRIR